MHFVKAIGLVAFVSSSGASPSQDIQEREAQNVGVNGNGGTYTGAVQLVLYQPALSPSVVFVTNPVTVWSCGPEVTNCPVRNGGGPPVVTSTVQVSTTVCPVTLTATTLASYTTPASESTNKPSDVNEMLRARAFLDPSISLGVGLTSLLGSGLGQATSLPGGASQITTLPGAVTSVLDTLSGQAPSAVGSGGSLVTGGGLTGMSQAPGVATGLSSVAVAPSASFGPIPSGVPASASSSNSGNLSPGSQSVPAVVGTLSYTYSSTATFAGISGSASAAGPTAVPGLSSAVFSLAPSAPIASTEAAPGSAVSSAPASGPAPSSQPTVLDPASSVAQGSVPANASAPAQGGVLPAPGGTTSSAGLAISSSASDGTGQFTFSPQDKFNTSVSGIGVAQPTGGVPQTSSNNSTSSFPSTGNSTTPEPFLGLANEHTVDFIMAISALAMVFALGF